MKGYFEFKDGVFHKSVFIGRGTYKKGLSVNGGKFLQEFVIQSGSNFHQEVKIGGGSFQEFSVFEGTFNEGITISGGEFKTINFTPKRIDDASYISKLSLNTEIKYPIFIKKYPINEIFISRLNYENGGIYLENLQLNKLIFSSFRNYGKVSIENLIAKEDNSSLQIINSDLGNCLALNADFNSFHHIVFNNSKLSKLNMYGVPIPFNSQKIFTNHKQERDHTQLADLYNQLYLAMQSQGYRDYEMKYYAAYLENHRLHLNEKNKECSTSIALCLHKFSTNYSQDWIRGVLLAIPITLVLFYLYFIALPEYEFAYDPNRWSQVTFNLFTTHYFEFLITPYRMNFIEGTNPGTFSNIIFIFSRIVIGFFIYQTIAAFRKFGKK